ncbi:hypothetical protein [Streptomyces sp. NPDC086787]|uniref:hypothetical protein n=1 Tax=Streptomyces sp. NPDC086787 TaxID=3365759 RepID=UPI00380D5090
MAPHHKSNRAVEGDPDQGHSRGMPRRPDEDEIAERTARERREAGLPSGPADDPETAYQEERRQIDHEVNTGEMPAGKGDKTTRRGRSPFPPSHYES